MSDTVLNYHIYIDLFYIFCLKLHLNHIFLHLKNMISTKLDHRLILQSLKNHQIPPTPRNLIRVLKLQDRRWDLDTEMSVRKEFNIREKSKIIFSFELKYKKIRLKYNSKISIIVNINLIKSYLFYFII